MNEPTPAPLSTEPDAVAMAAQADIRARFRRLRASAGLDGAVTVLHIGAEHTAMATG